MIDEQMKAPLPPPPARRARRSTRASQVGVPGQADQADSSRRRDSAAPPEAESRDRTQEADTSNSRGIESEESRGDGLTRAEPKLAEPQQESNSPEQASVEDKSPSQEQPQRQAAESVGLNQDSSVKPASHDDQNQPQVTGKDQDTPSQAQEQAVPSSEKSEQQDNTERRSIHSDEGDSVQKSITRDEPAAASSDVKDGDLDSHDAQERSHSRNGDSSIGTPSQGQDQASEAESRGVDSSTDTAGQSAGQPAVDDHREASPGQGRPDSSEKLATSEVRTIDKSDHQDESDQSRSQPTADEPTTSGSPADLEGLQGPDHDGLFHGVTKGGAAEEYVRMAEAESGQEPQLGGSKSATPEQGSSTEKSQQHEQEDGDSSRGLEEPGSIQVSTSTTDQASPEHTMQAQTDDRPSSTSGIGDSVEGKIGSPIGSEHESRNLQSRDIDSLDEQGSRHKPTLDPEKDLQSSSEQSELDHSRDLESAPIEGVKHEQPSVPSQDTSDAGPAIGEQLQESESGDHPQSENGSPESGLQQGDLERAHPQETEVGKAGIDMATGSEKGSSGPKPAEDQQEPHIDEQRDSSLETIHGEEEHPGHAMASQSEPAPSTQQDSSSPDRGVAGEPQNEAQLDKDIGDDEEHGSFGRHESSQGRQESQVREGDHVGDVWGEEGPRPSSHDTPYIVEPDDVDDLPHESTSEQEPGDKRSDSGYETGMASSRNLEDSTTTLHEGQDPAQGGEHSFASVPSEIEQEKTREPRPEQILEGSGKDVSPPRLGGEQQDSDDHPVEETFDLSGSEPIPGTMTHGKDQTEDQSKELTGEDVSLQDLNHQQPADNGAVRAAADDDQRVAASDESHESQNGEGPLSRESQQGDDDYMQPDPQSTAHEADDTISAGSRSQVGEEHVRQGGSQSPVGNLGHDLPGKIEGSSDPSAITEPQHRGSTSNTDQAGQLDPEDDIRSTTSRSMDEPQQETSMGDDGVITPAPASQEQISEPSHVSHSPTAHGLDPDQFGSWSSQAFSRPADDHEFSFKKRADSVQVGRSQGPADRGADLPSISTDGPNEDADEGLFAVPPTPRHEVDHDKPSQFQGEVESKPSSRASSRNGSTGADTLSPRAAEGLHGPYREENDRAVPQGTVASKDDEHHNTSQSADDGPQGNADALETSESPEEKTATSHSDAGEPSNREELNHGQQEEQSITGAEEKPHEASAENSDSQQAQQHDVDYPRGPEEQLIPSERHLNDSLQAETSSRDHHNDTLSKPGVNDDNREAQAGSDDQSRDTSDDPEAEPYRPAEAHDLEQDGSALSHLEGQAQQSGNATHQQEAAAEDSWPRDLKNNPGSEHVEQESSGTGIRGLGDHDQVQHGEVSQSQPFEDRPGNVSLEDVEPEPASGQDVKKIADPPRLDRGSTQHPESDSGLKGDNPEHSHANIDHAAHQPSPDHSSQHLDAQQVSYDGEGYGVTPSSEYSDDQLVDSAKEHIETHSAEDATGTRQPDTRSYDLPDSARATRNEDPVDSGSETFETPLESADFRKPQEDSRPVTSGNFTRALDHLPDESAHTVQGTDDLFDDTDDAEDQDDYGEAVVYQQSNEPADSSPSEEKTVYSTRGDENNTALGGHRSSLSLGSVGHRSQGSISSVRDTTPVRPTFGSYIGGPNIVRADWAAEHEEELRPPSLNPTPQLGPSTTHDTPEISPFALRNTPMPSHGNEQRGLNSSMWNPDRPQTPTSATSQNNNPFATPQRQAESGFDPSLYVPRDVTHGRQDSVPASLHSQTTLDSSWSSPVHSSLPIDRHEPVIRDSWPAPAPGYQQYLSSWSSRPRGDTTSTAAEYDPFKPDNGGAPGGHTAAKPSSSYNPFLQRGRAESSVSAAPSNPSVSNSPSRGSALFAKMRNIFESQGSNGANDVPASPGKPRPVSGVFHPATSAQRLSQDSATGQRDDERGGFLNEADHEIDERSAFLRSDGQPSGH